ncbi:MAG: GtrA family protein [Bacillota bacterium]|nr:GtrA family protein [Bacillota bacterium]
MGNSSFIDKLSSNRFLSKYMTPKIIKQLTRYIITGVFAAIVEFSVLYCLRTYVGFSLILSNSIAYTFGFCISFLMNKFWSFEARGELKRQLTLYTILFGINLLLSDALMDLFNHRLGLSLIISKVIAIGIITLWNFGLYKKIIYKR